MTGVRRGVLAAVVAVAVGAGIRVAPGEAPARAAGGGYAEIDTTHEQALPTSGPQRAAVDFYRSVIRGRYAAAFELSVEPRWHTGAAGRPVPAGIQSRRGFVGALDDEIGPEGMRVGVARLAVRRARPLPRSTRATELAGLAKLPGGTRVGAPVVLRVSGHLVGTCEISGFDHRVVLARVDGRWRVLLPGRRRPTEPHFERWFVNPGEA